MANGFDGDDGFDWNNDDSIVVRQQLATAVYCNREGDVVIRQQGDLYGDCDAVVVFNREFANQITEAIRNEATANWDVESSIPCGGCPKAPQPPSTSKAKDPTAAERQRRFSERQRSSCGEIEGVAGDGIAPLAFDESANL